MAETKKSTFSHNYNINIDDINITRHIGDNWTVNMYCVFIDVCKI